MENKYFNVVSLPGHKEEFNKLLSMVWPNVKTLDDNSLIVEENILEQGLAKLVENGFDKNLIQIAPAFEVGAAMKLKLYDYQKDVVKFGLQTGSALLALPCGSGKTPLVLALLQDLKRLGGIEPDGKALIVVKSSLKVQWLKEVEKFTDFKACIIETYKKVTTGISARINSANKRAAAIFADKKSTLDDITKADKECKRLEKEREEIFRAQFDSKNDIFIVNYETLRDDKVRKMLHKVNLKFLAADEVHMIKDPNSKRSKAIYEFNTVPYVYGSSATPIKRNPMDVYGICKLISPQLFPSLTTFQSRYVDYNMFGSVSGFRNEIELRNKLKDIMIVKSEEEISKQLPEVVEITRYCKLTDKQLKMHETLMEEIKEFKDAENNIFAKFNGKPPKDNPELEKATANIMARQTFAQELADTEELLASSESELAKKYITKSKSSKIELLLDTLEEIFENDNEKCVIFSRYQKIQEILAREIQTKFKNIKVAFVNGKLSGEERYDEVYNKFRDKSDYRILIMSDAGAEGISIGWCKYLIQIEPADSYALHTQRIGRVHRADSKFEQVYCYSLIAEESYDEIGLKIIQKKEKYDNQIIKGTSE